MVTPKFSPRDTKLVHRCDISPQLNPSDLMVTYTTYDHPSLEKLMGLVNLEQRYVGCIRAVYDFGGNDNLTDVTARTIHLLKFVASSVHL
jgi:hypothetical protein